MTKTMLEQSKEIRSAGSRLVGEEVGTPDAPAWPQDEQELPGGQGDKLTPADVDPVEFGMGMEMEKEHTEDEATRQEIVLDHLAEDPAYYSKLKQMEGQGVDVQMFGEMKAGVNLAEPIAANRPEQAIKQLEQALNYVDAASRYVTAQTKQKLAKIKTEIVSVLNEI
jgi:hypothetical protein